MELKRTPLYDDHCAAGAKLINFGGWEMPLQYASIIDEHLATRERVGLFDVSHMSEMLLSGRDAGKALNAMITNDVKLLVPGKVIYTLLPNESGGVVDDLLVYMLSETEYLLVANAANTDKDFQWITKQTQKAQAAGYDVSAANQSAEYGQIAVQGPNAEKTLQKLTKYDLTEVAYFRFAITEVCGAKCIVSRTGYTGEDGFEVYCEAKDTAKLWRELLLAGEAFGIAPVGLGARDTLRFEAGLPLYGHELRDDISPVEAGLKFAVKPDKGEFIGREHMVRLIQNGVSRKLVGLEPLDKGIPRADMRVTTPEGTDIGWVTSGMHAPSFKKGLAMAMIDPAFAQAGTALQINVRGRACPAKVVKLPFYVRSK